MWSTSNACAKELSFFVFVCYEFFVQSLIWVFVLTASISLKAQGRRYLLLNVVLVYEAQVHQHRFCAKVGVLIIHFLILIIRVQFNIFA